MNLLQIIHLHKLWITKRILRKRETMTSFKPKYLETHAQGLLEEKIGKAYKCLKACMLCPRRCGVNRLEGETGVCKTGQLAVISSFNAHFGEETPLVGRNGSGTVFFTHCNLLCNFCQNYSISREGEGHAVPSVQLASLV